MQDDTGHNKLANTAQDLGKVQNLWKFQVQRVKAQTWAYRDIRFLIYDDTIDTAEERWGSKAVRSNKDTAILEQPSWLKSRCPDHGACTVPQTIPNGDEDVMFKQAIIAPLKQPDSEARPVAAFDHLPEDDDMDDPDLQEAIRLSLKSNGESGNAPIATVSMPSVANADDDEDVFECRICSKLPTFPHDEKTRNFRLFKPVDEFPHLVTQRPGNVDVCVHYVAVSYCWPEETKDEDGNTVPPITESKVRDLNGRPRPARALDDVLDRAVDFAKTFGLRMIWIDQECLPQPKEDGSEVDKAYQRLGVQALDIVYPRAIVTAGLHASIITQAQMSAIDFLTDHDAEELRYMSLHPQLFEEALGFLHMVQSDEWYTRAWVIQEAVSAGNGMVLVFRRGPDVVNTPTYRTDRKKRSTPRHTLDTERRVLQSEIICIPVDLFRALVQTCKSLLEQRFQVLGQALVRARTNNNTIPILSIAESLHPKITARQHETGIHMYGGTIYGGRQKVNAATALTLLKSRHCRDVQDRLTILANMCSYEIRLDTDRVVKECDSLRLGILAIALLNGDTSILVPEVYEDHGEEIGDPGPSVDRRVGSLLSPFDTNFRGISSYAVQDGKLFNPALYKHSFDSERKALHLCAYLWTVDDILDLSTLKYQYADVWHMMKCLQVTVERQKEESFDEFYGRKCLITHHFSKKYVMGQAKLEIIHHGAMAIDSSIWKGLDARGVKVETYLDAYRVEAEPEMQRLVAEIFFAILRYLHGLSTIQSLGIANSGNRSARMPSTKGSRTCQTRTLQLDKDRRGGYFQAWIVDRIMQEGFLLVGRYDSTPDVPLVGVRPSRDLGEEESIEQNNGNLPGTIIQQQLVRRILATVCSAGIEGDPGLPEDHETKIIPSSMTWGIKALERDLFTPETEQARTQQLVSIFDVDGPCLIATVFNSDWEVLPRPEIRSMSTSWVIEPVKVVEKTMSGSPGDQSPALDEEQPIVGGKRKEPERLPHTSGTDDFTVGGKGKEPERVPSTPDAGDLGIASNTESAAPTMCRVVNKVKGMWQIMDLPMQEYAFV
ncbi:hypothetical protein CNYM01_12187 [Colletotrichum nymphaeae SA-01]|uniref:Heterokaryon incompatibility domain-containing protein n=1 Tax=Colletotrichum nymphaeae SA-01 TaxID=1460502 RepID=A0A135SPH8_9PEZI|nr:hypothetical protein CNYM01_12187 [Colletotrichum nymphaeae SA-01]